MSFNLDLMEHATPINRSRKKVEKKVDDISDSYWIRINATNYQVTVSPDLVKLSFSDAKYFTIHQAKTNEIVSKRTRISTKEKGKKFKIDYKDVNIDRHYIVLTGVPKEENSSQYHFKISSKRNGKKPTDGKIDNRPIYYSIKLKKDELDIINTKLTSNVKGIIRRQFEILEENIIGNTIAFDINDNSLIEMIRKQGEN